jgi:hypothetical protein
LESYAKQKYSYPQKYSEEIINALYSKVRKNEDENKKYVKVKDMFVIPDYSGFLVDFIDPHFANYSKVDMTQHPISQDYPCGCKTNYRAYSLDTIMEIKDDSNEKLLQMSFQKAIVSTFPHVNDQINIKDGTS